MAGNAPFFLTGANAKVKLNGKTLAFCTDLSYSVQVLTQTPKVLGMYEGSSVEPLGYSVSGSFTVIRYVKDVKKTMGARAPDGVAINDAGNGVGNWGNVWGGDGIVNFNAIAEKVGIGNSGRANEALDPSRFGNGTTFDIQVYQKVPKNLNAANNSLGQTIQNTLNTAGGILQGQQYAPETFSSTGVERDLKYDVIGVANIRNCRITQADFSINKKGAAMQRFNFTALYVDEDAYVADFSGRGQQL